MINSVIMLNPMLTDSNPQFQFRGLPKTLTEREEGDGGDRRRDGGGESAGDGEEGMLTRERGGGERRRGRRAESKRGEERGDSGFGLRPHWRNRTGRQRRVGWRMAA